MAPRGPASQIPLKPGFWLYQYYSHWGDVTFVYPPAKFLAAILVEGVAKVVQFRGHGERDCVVGVNNSQVSSVLSTSVMQLAKQFA